MFLSQLVLNPRAHDVQRDMRDAYQLHKTLSRAWPDADDYAGARVLFRLEEDRGASPIVLVQSQTAPDWEQLPSKYLQRTQSKQWQPQFSDGQRLAFRLRANPTIKREGKRCGLYLENERLSWLERKARTNGFALLSVTVRDEGREVVKNGDDDKTVRLRQMTARIGERRADFSAATFDGILQACDANCLQDALCNGIGSAKGLGFGLLSLART